MKQYAPGDNKVKKNIFSTKVKVKVMLDFICIAIGFAKLWAMGSNKFKMKIYASIRNRTSNPLLSSMPLKKLGYRGQLMTCC